jgi:hypothetical protein
MPMCRIITNDEDVRTDSSSIQARHSPRICLLNSKVEDRHDYQRQKRLCDMTEGIAYTALAHTFLR